MEMETSEGISSLPYNYRPTGCGTDFVGFESPLPFILDLLLMGLLELGVTLVAVRPGLPV